MHMNNIQTLDKLPGIEILNKYTPNMEIVLDSIHITVQKKVTHFDRQKLFANGWKQDGELIFSLNINLI